MKFQILATNILIDQKENAGEVFWGLEESDFMILNAGLARGLCLSNELGILK